MPEISNRKWGASTILGTSGGVVTWSLVDGGKIGVNDTFGSATAAGSSDVSVDASRVLSYDPAPLIRQAFAAWEQHADISFVQVRDSGAAVGASDNAQIRIAFGEIDGEAGSTLGLGFLPGQASFSGDILIDSDEQTFFARENNFLRVVVHEIGHAIGLDHVAGVRAVMNAFLTNLTEPVADDISGIRQIYGATKSEAEIALGFGRNDIDIVDAPTGVAIRGNDTANDVRGGAGGERIFGEGGDDRLIGRGGFDSIAGGAGADTLKGGAGRDKLWGGDEADKLLGGRDNDRLTGGAGDDILRGGAGDDRHSGGEGDDVLTGGGGNDRLAGGDGGDRIVGGRGRDIAFGGEGDDLLIGAGDADRLNGGGGADTLRGGAGNDMLRGGTEDDLLLGGGGADRFQFETGGGDDRVADFAAGVDRLDLSRVEGATAFGDLTLQRESGDTRIALGDDASVLLVGVRPNELSADDFIF